MQYPEPSQYAFHNKSREDWTEKDYDDWGVWRNDLHSYWSWLSKRRFHALPEDKGIPVPGTGIRRNRRSWTHNGQSVSAGSHVLSHYYASEGDKGRHVRKLVRNRERALWLSEWQREQNDDAEYGYAVDAYSAGEWFDDNPYTWDWYYGEDDYDPEDYYPRAWDDLWDMYECFHCGGPCEL